MKYRPDIDGLRAVAVLSVVAFHAFPSSFQAGFIGVDIFFVISGFLISNIIFTELNQSRFSFLEFYSRRIKRIFPALITVLASCFTFGWFVLFEGEYTHFAKHMAAGAGFISNFVLWNEAGYFDVASETKPLLHLWSLGIEEQFYILWPLLLWFAWKQKFNILSIVSSLIVVSFYLNIKGVNNNSVATFYAPQTRFWELLTGSLLAWLSIYSSSFVISAKAKISTLLSTIIYSEKQEDFEEKVMANAFSIMGLIFMFLGFLIIDKSTVFPGVMALLPVLGAFLIILAGPLAWFNNFILSNRLMVWFGLISFPLYLWHWPLLSFSRILASGDPSRSVRIIAIILSIILAWLTYLLIERPVRSGRRNKIKVMVLILLMSLMLVTGIITKRMNGMGFRDINQLTPALNSGDDGGYSKFTVDDCGISNPAVKKLFQVCAKDIRNQIHYALIGDSKAAALYGGLVRTSKINEGWVFIGGNGPNGAPLPLIKDNNLSNQLTLAAYNAIANNKQINTVLIASAIRNIFQISDGVKNGNLSTYDYKYLKNLENSNNYEITLDQMDRAVVMLLNANKKVILLIDNPALPNPSDCISRITSINLINKTLTNKNPDCFVPLSLFLKQTQLYRKLLAEIKAKHPNSVEIFDPTEIYCDRKAGVCGPNRYGRTLYSYTDHISDYASTLVGDRINDFIEVNSRSL